ncbi:MAG: hypothetical protein KDD43_09470 [Bdellovibrionales bacterium]|nr:hypothetical protein [Bdellovibrionales bacterium]
MKRQTHFRHYILPLLLCVISMASVHCAGESGISSKVNVEVVPERPVVIDTDFTLRLEDGDGDPDTFETEQVTAPWFLFGYKIKNNSDKTITVVNFKITVSGKKGTEVVSTDHALDLEDLGTNVTYLEEISAGGSASRFTDTRWFIDTLSKDADSFAYQVTVELQGWVGKSTNPEERLTKSFTFSTQ